MSVWRFTGAGDPTYDGDYRPLGTYDGHAYYGKHLGGGAWRYLYWGHDTSGRTQWVLGTYLGDFGKYSGAWTTPPPVPITPKDLPANDWTRQLMGETAPVCEEVVAGAGPYVEIIYPPPGTYGGVFRLWAWVLPGNEALTSVHLFDEAVDLGSLTDNGDGRWYFDVNTLDLGDGAHTLTVLAVDAAALEGSDSVAITVDNGGGGPGGDVTPPVVSIEAPLSGAGVAGGAVTIRATATDDVGVVSVEAFAAGISLGVLTEPDDDGKFVWTWDARDWANGAILILVQAQDAAENTGTDTVNVVVANSIANLTRTAFQWRSPTHLPEARKAFWRDEATFELLKAMSVITPGPLPALAKDRYNCFLGVAANATADSTTFGDYAAIENGMVHGFPATPCTSCAWALKQVPTRLLSHYDVADSVAAIRLAAYTRDDVERVALLVSEASGWSLWLYNGSSVAKQRLEEDAGAAVDLAYCDGKLCVGLADGRVYVHDLDSGQEATIIALPIAGETITAVCALGTDLLLGTDDGDGGGRVWRYSWPATTILGTTAGPVERLVPMTGGVLIGCAGGKVYSTDGSVAPTLVYDTEEAHIAAALDFGDVLFAGTGSAGKLFCSHPAWALEETFGSIGTIRGLAGFGQDVYAGGNQNVLWRRQAAADWVSDEVLTAGAAIADLAVCTLGANGAQQLLIAVTVGGVAQLYVLEIAPASDTQTGPEPPDWKCEVLAMRRLT